MKEYAYAIRCWTDGSGKIRAAVIEGTLTSVELLKRVCGPTEKILYVTHIQNTQSSAEVHSEIAEKARKLERGELEPSELEQFPGVI